MNPTGCFHTFKGISAIYEIKRPKKRRNEKADEKNKQKLDESERAAEPRMSFRLSSQKKLLM